jgi:ribosomal protein L1
MQISEVIGINLDARQQQRKQIAPTKPIADQLKHELVIRRLTRQLTRKSNLPNPSRQDVNAAIQRYKTDQKRADLDYQKQLNSAQR